MKILGIESSSLVASAAIVTDDELTAEYTVNFKKTHSQTLLPMIDEIVRMVELDLGTLDAIAVAAGPGSFTGLRIGTATAKGLGLAVKKPLIHVPTLDAMAFNLWGSHDLVCPIMDARRSQVYTGLYHMRRGIEVVKGQRAMAIEELIECLEELGEPVIFLGDGVPVNRHILEEKLKVPFDFAPGSHNRQRAAAVAALGMEYLKKGITTTAADLVPDYLRKSQAEREMEEKHGQMGQ